MFDTLEMHFLCSFMYLSSLCQPLRSTNLLYPKNLSVHHIIDMRKEATVLHRIS